MKVSAALAKKIEGQTFYQDPVSGEVYGSPEAVPKAKPTPEITLTSKGPAYTSSGQLVKEATQQQIKSQAFEFLAPAEKFVAKRAGSLEGVYSRVVQPKLAMQRESAELEQQMIRQGARPGELGGYMKTPGLRAKQLLVEAKAGAFDMVTAPIETAAMIVGLKTLPTAGAGSATFSPAATGVGLTSAIGIARNPQDPAMGIARTTGEAAVLVAGSASLDLVGGKNIPKWGFEDIKYPGKKGGMVVGKEFSGGYAEIPEGPAEIQAYKGLKFGERNLVGVEYSASGNKFKVGTPSLKLTPGQVQQIDLTGYTPGTSRTEARFAQNIADQIYPSTEARKSRLITDLISSTEITRSLERGRLFPEQTRSLSKEGTQNVLKFARKEDALAYGSFTAEPQLPKGESLGILRGTPKGEPVAGDIDLQLKWGDTITQQKTQKLLGTLSKTDIVRISPESPSLIESKVGGKWIHAVDVHSIDAPLDADIPMEGAWGFRFDKSPNLRIEGVKSMALSETRTRKAASILTFREEGFAPEQHRLKDIPDFITTQEYLTRVGKPTDLPKVAELKGLYGKDLPSSGSQRVPIFSPPTGQGVSFITPISPAALITPKVKASISPGVQPRASISPSAGFYPSVSISPGRSISASISPSRSISTSLSISPSITPSPSPGSTSPGSGSPSRSVSPSISPGSSSPYSYSPGWAIPSPKLPSLGMPLQLFGGGRGKKVKFKPKYFASIEAVAFGIKGKRPSKQQLQTGLDIRPMVR